MSKQIQISQSSFEQNQSKFKTKTGNKPAAIYRVKILIYGPRRDEEAIPVCAPVRCNQPFNALRNYTI